MHNIYVGSSFVFTIYEITNIVLLKYIITVQKLANHNVTKQCFLILNIKSYCSSAQYVGTILL